MTPVAKIALRRIKNAPGRSLLIFLSLLFSVMLITCFTFFAAESVLREDPALSALPMGIFLGRVRGAMYTSILFLVLTAAVTLRLQSNLRRRQNTQILAVLTSVGATAKQRRDLVTAELRLVCYPAVLAGSLLGAPTGIFFARHFPGGAQGRFSSGETFLIYLALWFIVVLLGILLVTLCVCIPELGAERGTAIGRIRGQSAASTEHHGYRQSRTFREQSVMSRLAKKCADYHRTAYSKIAVSFSVSAFYPVLALLLTARILGSEVTLDANPYDGIDTAGAVMGVVRTLLLFLGGSFAVLTIFGAVGGVLMTRLQYADRLTAKPAYLAVGLTDTDFRTLLRREMATVTLRTLVFLLIWSMTASAVFAMVLGG